MDRVLCLRCNTLRPSVLIPTLCAIRLPGAHTVPFSCYASRSYVLPSFPSSSYRALLFLLAAPSLPMPVVLRVAMHLVQFLLSPLLVLLRGSVVRSVLFLAVLLRFLVLAVLRTLRFFFFFRWVGVQLFALPVGADLRCSALTPCNKRLAYCAAFCIPPYMLPFLYAVLVG